MNTFTIHYHIADRAGPHYDLRLESGGVMESWAIPKGLPTTRGVKHLAIKVEDHPLEYAGFEGEIKEGYGKGTVEIFDDGIYTPIIWKNGTIRVRLDGEKIHGEYILRHWKGNMWLIWRT